ncbi:hypothetical protein ACFE04_008504 [Oxalis oulophora]
MNPAYLFSFVLLLAIFPNGFHSQNIELISTTCSKTSFNDYCMKILNGSRAFNLTDIAEIVLKTARLHALRAEEDLKTLHGKDSKTWETCFFSYKDVVQSMMDAVTDVEAKRYENVIPKAKTAIKAATNCSTSYKGKLAPIAGVNQELIITCKIAIPIVEKLNRNPSQKLSANS